MGEILENSDTGVFCYSFPIKRPTLITKLQKIRDRDCFKGTVIMFLVITVPYEPHQEEDRGRKWDTICQMKPSFQTTENSPLFFINDFFSVVVQCLIPLSSTMRHRDPYHDSYVILSLSWRIQHENRRGQGATSHFLKWFSSHSLCLVWSQTFEVHTAKRICESLMCLHVRAFIYLYYRWRFRLKTAAAPLHREASTSLSNQCLDLQIFMCHLSLVSKHNYINLLKVMESRAEGRIDFLSGTELLWQNKYPLWCVCFLLSGSIKLLLFRDRRSWGAAALPLLQALPPEDGSAERSSHWLAPPSPGGPAQSFSSGLFGEIRGCCQVSSVTVSLTSIPFSS